MKTKPLADFDQRSPAVGEALLTGFTRESLLLTFVDSDIRT
jgi:hypothetical protein